MTLGARALEVAVSQLGVRESPPRSNRGPAVDRYLRAVRLDPERGSYAWCAAFVSWCIQAASVGWAAPVFWRSSSSCARLWRGNRGLLLEAPEVACVFVHLREDGKGHAGFVTGLRDDGDLVTCEGNTDASGSRTGGQVMAQRRPAGYATRYLRVA